MAPWILCLAVAAATAPTPPAATAQPDGAATDAQATAPAGPIVPPTIGALLEPKEAFIGDTVVLRMSIKHAEADLFEFPMEIAWGSLELLDKAARQTRDGPMITEELVFKLTGYEPGEANVPEIAFKVGGQLFKSQALPLLIKSVIEDEKQTLAKRGEAPPENAETVRKADGEPLAVYERVYWPFVVLGLVFLLAAAWLFWKRRKPNVSVQAAVEQSSVPAHKAALMLLKLLRDKDLLAQGKHREYYFEATEILRGYLQQRYAINALDLTTAELMDKLTLISAPGLDREQLRAWLQHADMVKFAKMEPMLDKAAGMVDFFEQQIWATRPPAPKTVEAA